MNLVARMSRQRSRNLKLYLSFISLTNLSFILIVLYRAGKYDWTFSSGNLIMTIYILVALSASFVTIYGKKNTIK
jgi:hypothetical protein